MLEQWQEEHAGDFTLARMKTPSQKFLIVIQTEWQKKMLTCKRYGSEVTLLDGTYSTTKFEVPLFVVAVKTNANYQVAAVFLTEQETTNSIEEALAVVKSENPTWCPKHYMTDLDEREIGAMSSLFPESQGLLCAFHRLQAWNRWLSRADHKVKEPKYVKQQMVKMVDSLTEDEFQLHLSTFLSSTRIESNVKNYFNRTWLPVKEKWVRCYQKADVAITTNNGLERLHNNLKHQHLSGRKQIGISTLLGVLLKSFFPQLKDSYVQENSKWITPFKTVNEEIPDYLIGRPHWMVKHCLKRIALAEHMSSCARYHVNLGDKDTQAAPVLTLSSGSFRASTSLGQSRKEGPMLGTDYLKDFGTPCS